MIRNRIVLACLALPWIVLAVPLAAAMRPRQNPFGARPAEEHALLAELAGTWTAEFELLMPGAPPVKSKSREVNEMLGALWVVGRYDDPGMMGGAYHGASLVGYDPAKEKYVSAWADSMTASLSLQEGTYDAATRTLSLAGPSEDPLTGHAVQVRTTHVWSDDDHRVQTMFVPGPDGAEMEMFRITYAREK